MQEIKERLEYLRGELRDECISYGELAELQSLAEYIEDDDVELLEAAGVPEGQRNETRRFKPNSNVASRKKSTVDIITGTIFLLAMAAILILIK